MKNLKLLVFAMAASCAMIFAGESAWADTGLSKVQITGTKSDGSDVDVYITSTVSTNSDTIEAVAPSGTSQLTIDATTVEEGANVVYEWTNMDEGDNESHIIITDSEGNKRTVNVYTKVDDDSYNEYVTTDDEASSDLEVILQSGTYYVQKKLKGIKLPEGYERKRIKYAGTKVWSGYSEAKDTTILYLVNENGKGKFFIYDQEKDSFKVLREIKVKSRLYTVMYPEKTDKYLRKFKKQTIKIGSEKVKVWVHNEAEEMYLIYLMNWDGEVALYQFDAKENVFQRFIISDSQEEALNTAEQTFDDLDEKYQAMVHKYNKDNSAKWKVIIALISVIVVLAFVILNLILKILSQKRIVLDVEEKALRATTKKSKYLVGKPGIKTVVPNQKVVKKPKEDVEVKDVVPTGYDDISIDMTDDVIKEYEKSSKPDSVANKEADVKIKSVTPADVKSKKVATTAVKETEEKPVWKGKTDETVKLAAEKVTQKPIDDDDDDDGFEFIEIED